LNRRDFLKILGITPLAPAVLCAKEKPAIPAAISLEEWAARYRVTEPVKATGKYLVTDSIKCLRCNFNIEIKEGYYELGSRMKCRMCGNTHKFMCFAHV